MPTTPGLAAAWAAVATLTSVTLLAERGLVRPSCPHPSIGEAPADQRSIEAAAATVEEATKVALRCVEEKDEAKDVRQVLHVAPESTEAAALTAKEATKVAIPRVEANDQATEVQQVLHAEPQPVVLQDVPVERRAEEDREEEVVEGGAEPVAWDVRLLGGVLGASLALDLLVFPLAIYGARLCCRRAPRAGKSAPATTASAGAAAKAESVPQGSSAARKKGPAASARRRQGGPPPDSSAGDAPEATPEELLDKDAEEGDPARKVEADGDDEEATTPTQAPGDDGAASEVPASEPPSLPCEDSGDVDAGTSQVRPGRRGKLLDLAEVMQQQRERCEEYESLPRCGVRTDAVAEEKKDFSSLPGSRAALEAQRAKDAAAHALEKRPKKTDEELKKLMEVRRNQCANTTVVA